MLEKIVSSTIECTLREKVFWIRKNVNTYKEKKDSGKKFHLP